MNSGELLEKLKNTRALLLLFDFDGTLVEIAPSPDLIKPHPDLLKFLDDLSKRPTTNVAVLSGRKLSELETYIPPSLNIALAGSHGARIRMPGKEIQSLYNDADMLGELVIFLRAIEPLSKYPGILIEEKEASIAMHYRLAELKIAQEACCEFVSQAVQLKNFKELEILEGKMIKELRPRNVNKGVAVRFLYREFLPSKDALAVYIGDDTTDLDAFRALPEGSIRVAIGKTISNLADCFLKSPRELLDIIRRLLE